MTCSPKYITSSIFVIALWLSITACNDWIAVPAPETDIVRQHVFEDDASALAAMTSIYAMLSTGSTKFTNGGLAVYTGLYADELLSYAANTSENLQFFQNSVLPTNQPLLNTWTNGYTAIYSANMVAEGLEASTGVSTSIRNQLTGEALFMRAFCHFYLVNLFGAVPLIKTSDYRANAVAARTPAEQVYEGIIEDLLTAKELLNENYPTVGRVRPNRGVALALLARTYLYIGDYENAERFASEVISRNTQYKLETDLNAVFLKNSEEAIWQLLPSGGTMQYTYEGFAHILIAAPPTSITLSDELYASFEQDDLRKSSWTNELVSTSGLSRWPFAYKYKETVSNRTGAEYSMVMRLAEQYLIRAEARAHLQKLTGANSAASDIDVIRNRAGLSNTTANTVDELLLAIERERRAELFTEWGHRFFDLKRTNRANAVLNVVKPNWEDTDILFPIPQNEILLNKNLQPQNPGY